MDTSVSQTHSLLIKWLLGSWDHVYIVGFVIASIANSAAPQVSCPNRSSYCTKERVNGLFPKQQCPFSSSMSQCNYSRLQFGNETLPTASSMNIPGRPRNMKWSLFSFASQDNCLTGINITWMLPAFGAQFLTGFHLSYSYLYRDGRRVNGYRIFNIQPINHQSLQTVFYYDCMPVDPGPSVTYRIALQSLPVAPPDHPEHNNNITLIVFPPPGQSDNTCNASWIPGAIVSPSVFDSTVNVRFDPAPECYGFKGYSISLVLFNSNGSYTVWNSTKVYTKYGKNYKDVIRHQFAPVCPHVYRVMIHGFMNESCECLERDSLGRSTCVPCDIFEISPVDMTGSQCSSDETVTPLPTPSPVETSEAVVVNNYPNHLLGAVAGCLIAFVLVLIVVIVFRRYKMPQPELKQKPKILLVYFDIHEELLRVIENFAIFLQRHFECDVNVERWCSTDGVKHQVAITDRIVLIPPELYIRRLPKRMDSVSPMNSLQSEFDNLPPEMYWSAFNLMLAECATNHSHRDKLSIVCFRCSKFPIVKWLGFRVYLLMSDIDKFLTDIFGSTPITTDNYSESSEGMHLYIALQSLHSWMENQDSGYYPDMDDGDSREITYDMEDVKPRCRSPSVASSSLTVLRPGYFYPPSDVDAFSLRTQIMIINGYNNDYDEQMPCVNLTGV